MEGHTGY